MPYIEQDRRERYDEWLVGLIEELDTCEAGKLAGDLNYIISTLLASRGKVLHSPNWNYGKINELIGVLECAKLELYRRVAQNYETQKMLQNGDVY